MTMLVGALIGSVVSTAFAVGIYRMALEGHCESVDCSLQEWAIELSNNPAKMNQYFATAAIVGALLGGGLAWLALPAQAYVALSALTAGVAFHQVEMDPSNLCKWAAFVVAASGVVLSALGGVLPVPVGSTPSEGGGLLVPATAGGPPIGGGGISVSAAVPVTVAIPVTVVTEAGAAGVMMVTGSGGGLGNGPDNLQWWNRRIEFQGKKVYQRDDLIDPNLVDARGRTNLGRMKKGLAPIGPDGRSMTLHHLTQADDSVLAEVTATMHEQNKSILNINPDTYGSAIDRAAFKAWREDYWMSRAKGFGK